jgi:hypothetical protein
MGTGLGGRIFERAGSGGEHEWGVRPPIVT